MLTQDKLLQKFSTISATICTNITAVTVLLHMFVTQIVATNAISWRNILSTPLRLRNMSPIA
jgi:hypothetical protein